MAKRVRENPLALQRIVRIDGFFNVGDKDAPPGRRRNAKER
jgi:hypothetical protein